MLVILLAILNGHHTGVMVTQNDRHLNLMESLNRYYAVRNVK